MELLTKEIIKKLPPIYSNENKKLSETKVIIKFFTPFANASWYVTEFNFEDQLFFGFANLGDDQMAELGYFSLKELEEIKNYSAAGLERDLDWNQETSLEDVINFRVR